jgi:hypothetical protein
MRQNLQKTNVMLFHSKFYYFHQFIVKNYKCLDLSFCYIIKENLLIFVLQVVASKYDDWLQSYDKNAKTPDRYEIFITNFKLVQNKKKIGEK